MGEQFAVGEVDTIHDVGNTLLNLANNILDIDAAGSGFQSGFQSCASAMASSAMSGACAGKDALLIDLLSRAAGRVEQVGNACIDAGNELIDTENESAAAFRAIGEF